MNATQICRLGLATLALAVLPAAATLAQSIDAEPNPADEARFQYGSFAFTPGVVFSTGYDSNISREPGGVSDYETYAVPQAEAFYTAGKARFNSQAAAEFVHLQEHSNESANNWAYNFGFRLADNPFRPYVSYSARRTNARPTGFEIGERSLRVENQFNAGASTWLTDRFSVTGGANWNRINYDASAVYQDSSLQEKLNRDTNVYVGGVGYLITPLTSFSANVDFIQDRFVYSPERDGDSLRIMGGMEFSKLAWFVGNGYVGYRHFTSKASGVADFNGWVANGHLSHVSAGGDILTLHFGRDVQFSFDTSLGYFVQTGFDGNYNKRLWDRIELMTFGGYSALDYRYAGLPGGLGLVDHYFSAGGGLGYRIQQRIRIGTTFEHVEKTGEQAYTATRIIFFMTYGSGRYLRLDRPIPFEQGY